MGAEPIGRLTVSLDDRVEFAIQRFLAAWGERERTDSDAIEYALEDLEAAVALWLKP